MPGAIIVNVVVNTINGIQIIARFFFLVQLILNLQDLSKATAAYISSVSIINNRINSSVDTSITNGIDGATCIK